MKTVYSYACRDYPGMEQCGGRFTAETEMELMRHVELHASVAHAENPAEWSEKERAHLKTLIRKE